MCAWNSIGECSEQARRGSGDSLSARCKRCLDPSHGAVSAIAEGKAIPGSVSDPYQDKLEAMGFVIGGFYTIYPGFRKLAMPEGWTMQEGVLDRSYEAFDQSGSRRVRIVVCTEVSASCQCIVLPRYEYFVDGPHDSAGLYKGYVMDNKSNRVICEEYGSDRNQLVGKLKDVCYAQHPRPLRVDESWIDVPVAA